MNTTIEADVNQLNSFLRGELAAVETYDQAIDKINDSHVQGRLREVRLSHEQRASLLRQRVLSLGGEPAEGSGLWGSFAQLVEGGAKLFGPAAAISALEEGEDHGRDDYRRDLTELTSETRTFISRTILPEQQRTHDAIRALKNAAN